MSSLGFKGSATWGLRGFNWVPVRGLNLSCHNKEAILFTVDPYDGNLN